MAADPQSPESTLGGTTLGQLILDHGILVRMIDRQFGERALDLMPDTAHSDTENALASLNEIDDLVSAGALVYGCPIAHQRHRCQVFHAALMKRVDGGADLLQGDAGIEQPLHDLECRMSRKAYRR